MRMLSKRLTNLALLLMTAALAGCDTWKRADARAGRFLALGVSTIQHDGRDLICIEGKRSLAIIDQRGGRLVDFRPLPAGALPKSPATQPDGDSPATKPACTLPPRIVGGMIEVTPARPGFVSSNYWQVDAGPGYVVLLSDRDQGLRCSKKYRVHDDGQLVISVRIDNVSSKELQWTAGTGMDVDGPVHDGIFYDQEEAYRDLVSVRDRSNHSSHIVLRQVVQGPRGDHLIPPRKFNRKQGVSYLVTPEMWQQWRDIGPVTRAPGEFQEWNEVWSFHRWREDASRAATRPGSPGNLFRD